MAKVYFRYGTMNSGKSIDLLKVAHNYEEQGKHVLVLSPAIDTRSPEDVVESRIGISHKAVPITPDSDIMSILGRTLKEHQVACILVDEAQFLTKKHVVQLCTIADFADIPVITYGLRTDFQGELFEGSKHLMAMADNLEEIKTTCWCGKKATVNARYVDGKIATTGDQIQIGGNELYKPLCRKHFTEEIGKAMGIEVKAINFDEEEE